MKYVNNLEFKNELLASFLAAVILVSMLFASLPLVRADYTVDHASFPPDLPGDVNCDGKVDGKDIALVARSFGSWPGCPPPLWWNARCDVNDDGKVDGKDISAVSKLNGKFYNTSAAPVAYSASFQFDVPSTGTSGVWYYILAGIYMPQVFTSNTSFLVGTTSVFSAFIKNVIIDTTSASWGGGSGQFNISLGQLSRAATPSDPAIAGLNGYHLLELSFSDYGVGGSVNFSVVTAAGEVAWLYRFRVCVPNYAPAEAGYTVKTHTYFPPTDTYYLGGYADDDISDLYVGVGCLYQDWEWNSQSGPSISGWDFMYPLDRLGGWYDTSFNYGNVGKGILDFQYLSRTQQLDKVGEPKFRSQMYAPDPSFAAFLTLYDEPVFAGSEWNSIPGSRQRITAGFRILANETDTYTYFPIPQEAEVSLTLDVPGSPWKTNTYQDIGVYVNLTYTYFINDSVMYGMPLWFGPSTISVNAPTQGGMLNIPTPSIVFSNQSTTSFINPAWRVLGDILGGVTGALIATSGDWPLVVGAVGAAVVGGANTGFFQYGFQDQQILNWTTEQPGSASSRNYAMGAFRTTEDQLPVLSPPVGSVCSAYFFRVWASSPTNAGGVTIDFSSIVWLPFFYNHTPPNAPNQYGTWLPIIIHISCTIPVFIED